jgi:transposase
VAHFVRELVREELDLSAIFATYDEERGAPPFHPTMMTALLLYAYSQGVYSSRKIARACEERVDFMAVTALQRPDFRTVSKFRLHHLSALEGLFKQVLRLCQKAGMVTLGHVALDGTKVKANASKRKAMSYERMLKGEAQLEAEVARWFSEAEAADVSDDAEQGRDRRGDELPAWVADRQKRLEKIREAKAALEAEAAATAERDKPRGGGGRGGGGEGEPPKVKAKAQRNFTDPESRILKTSDGFVQGYNAQLAVCSERQVIVAHDVVAEQNDAPRLPEMLAQIRANAGRQATELSADNGYFSEANLRELKKRRVRGYVAPGRTSHGNTKRSKKKGAPRTPLAREMAVRVRRGGHRSRYRLFSLRGKAKVRGEWSLLCTVHNLLKLAARRG